MTQQELERIARLEEQNRAIQKKLDEHAVLLREVRDVIVSARGAKWAIVGMIGLSGGLGAFLSQFLPR